MDRPGDMPNEERVNSGQCELSHFFPTQNPEKEADVAMTTGSPMRMKVYLGVDVRRPHQSTDRSPRYTQGISLPDYVISSRIQIGNRIWDYRTTNDLSKTSLMRRVFIERNQAIELEIDETLKWLNEMVPLPSQEYPPILENMPGNTPRQNEIALLKAQAKYQERINRHKMAQARYARVISQLEAEASPENTNNQIIMQIMYDRIKRGESMLPWSGMAYGETS